MLQIEVVLFKKINKFQHKGLERVRPRTLGTIISHLI